MKYTAIEIQKEIPIYSGEGVSKDLKKYLAKLDFDKIIIITDSKVEKLWKEDLSQNLNGFEFDFFVFKAGEKSKNFKTYHKLCNNILDKSYKDSCYSAGAKNSNDCLVIIDKDKRMFCLSEFNT